MNDEIEKNTEIARVTAKRNHAKLFLSTFEVVVKFRRVLITLPDINNPNIRWVSCYKEVALNHPNNAVAINEHYEEGVKIGNKLIIIGYYNFSLKDYEDREVIAKVSVIKKNNYQKGGEETFIIKVCKNEKTKEDALFKLEVGSSTGQFLIPGTTRFVNFISLNKNNKVIEPKNHSSE